MELMLIRHGLPVRQEVSEGTADPELSPAGREQARHLAQYLASEPIDAIYSSPMKRARETAAGLAAVKGLPVTIIDEVAECDRNASEYVPLEELKAAGDPRWRALAAGDWSSYDETPQQFHERVVTACERLIDAHAGQRIAVSCHGGVINAVVAHVLGLGVRQGIFYPNYTSIHRVAASRGGHRGIITLNETAHLRGTGLPIGMAHR